MKTLPNVFQEFSEAVSSVYSPWRNLAVALVAVMGFLLVINGSWKATPDSALYLELGESLHRGAGYVFNGEPHTYVPPGYPAMVALSAFAIGEGFITYRILMALMGALTAMMGYLFVRRMCGPDVGLLVGGLFAVNHVLLQNSTFTTSDVPFALFTLIALNAVLWAVTRGGDSWAALLAAGLLAGLPPLIRVNGWGILPAEAWFLFCSRAHRTFARRSLETVVFLIAGLIIPAGWEAYKATFPVSLHEGTYLNVMSGRNALTHAQIVLTSVWDYVHEISYAITGASLKTGFLEFIFPVVALVGLIEAFRRGERLLAPLTAIQFGGLVLAPAGSRYLLSLIPALYLFFALGLLGLARTLAARVSFRWQPKAKHLLVGCFALFGAINVGHNAITVFEARGALEVNGAESDRDLPFFKAGRWLKENGAGAVVLSMHPRVIHYLSGCPTAELVRSGVPEHETWVDTQEQLGRIIAETRPAFLFADASNKILYDPVMKAFEGLNLRLEDIPETRGGNRFRLWRIMYP